MKRAALILSLAASGLLAVSAREFHATFDGYVYGFEGQTVTVQAETFDRGLDPYYSNKTTAVVGTNAYLNAVVTFCDEVFNKITFAQLDGKLPNPLPIRWSVLGQTVAGSMSVWSYIHTMPYAAAAAEVEDVIITGSVEVAGDLTVTGQTTVTNVTAQTLALAKTDSTKGSVTLAPQNTEFYLTGATAELVAPLHKPLNYIGDYRQIATETIGGNSSSSAESGSLTYTAETNCLFVIDLWGKLVKKSTLLGVTASDQPVALFGISGSTGQAARFFAETFETVSGLDEYGALRPWLTMNTPNVTAGEGVKSRIMLPLSAGESITVRGAIGSMLSSSFLHWKESMRGFSYSRITGSQMTMTVGIYPITTLEVVK